MNNFAPSVCQTQFTQGQIYRIKRFLTTCSTSQAIVSEDQLVIGEGLSFTYDEPFDFCLPTITIKEGARLTIKTDIQFQKEAKIIVEKGGRLIVDGGTLRGCDGAYWDGIEAYADASNGQIPVSTKKTGYVLMKNNSTVMNAIPLMEVVDGAMVICYETDFVDCGRARFLNYPLNNISRFAGCSFDRSSSFQYSSKYWPAQIELVGVNNVLVQKTEFTTVNPTTGYNGEAIKSYASRFTVDNSRIEGYRRGILDYGAMETPFGGFVIKDNIFVGNWISVSTWKNNQVVFQDNQVNGIGDYNLIGSTKPHQGLHMVSSTGFTVRGNTFTGTLNSTSADRIGAWVKDTGSENNQIIGNTYEDLIAGNQAEGDNKGLDEGEGLQYLCNTNQGSNLYDFRVFDDGIAESQGGGLAAKNTFSFFNSTDCNGLRTCGKLIFQNTDIQ